MKIDVQKLPRLFFATTAIAMIALATNAAMSREIAHRTDPIKIYAPTYRMQELDQLMPNHFMNAYFLRISYQKKMNPDEALAIYSHALLQDAASPGTSYQITQSLDQPCLQICESEATPNFRPPESCGSSVENRRRMLGKGKLLATTANGRKIWETELNSFDGKSAHNQIKVIVVKIDRTLLEFDLQNASKKPTANDWRRVVESLKETQLKDLGGTFSR